LLSALYGRKCEPEKMCFTSWDKFREEFTAAFCPVNEAMTALMRLK
jgi:hypothetical protein